MSFLKNSFFFHNNKYSAVIGAFAMSMMLIAILADIDEFHIFGWILLGTAWYLNYKHRSLEENNSRGHIS